MLTELRRALLGWVVLALATALGFHLVTDVESVPLAFLSIPAGFLLALVVGALRYYFGDLAPPSESS